MEKFCKQCGAELEESRELCPNCEKGMNFQGDCSNESMEMNQDEKKINFEGFRRTGRFGFQYLKSEIEIRGDKICAVIQKKKEKKITFFKQDIAEIKFPILPVIGAMDIFRIILFLVLTILLKGRAIFALLLFVKITLVRHIQIGLNNGTKVAIPIRQKAETVELLHELNYPESQVEKIKNSAVSNSKITIGEWITTVLMLILAAATIAIN